jgi:hypothetical protein
LWAPIYLALVLAATFRQSATWDEPQHLTAGYLARAAADYRFDPEHPPFLRLWAAWPVKPERVITKSAVPFRGQLWLFNHQFQYCHEFLYRWNDADQLLNRARVMNALWGVLLGVLLFAFAHERFGYWPAVAALLLYTVEPNLLAHAGLVTTDFGITCFAFGAVYFLWRWMRAPSWANTTGMVLFFVLAQISKFTGILLFPIVGLGGVLAVLRGRVTVARAAGLAGLLLVTTYAAVWAAYSFRYWPAPNSTESLGVREMEIVQQRVPQLARAVGWLADRRVLPNAYLEGFLLGQSKAKVRSAYLAGRHSDTGWWYYFPAAFLLKTPVALLALWGVGLYAVARRWRRSWADDLWLIVPVVVFMGTAMMAKLNIGLRHVLPMYPFVILCASGAVAAWWPRRRVEASVVVGLAAIELAFVYPHCLAFFNFTMGGPAQGGRYLVDSNLDWGQDLKGLKAWMQQRGVTQINLAYFGTAAPEYYGINCIHLPGGPFFAETKLPQLPGYVAVSETNLRGVYLSEPGRAFYRPLQEREPVAHIGYSIKIYWADKPWW